MFKIDTSNSNNDDNEDDSPTLASSKTKVYNSVRFEKRLHTVCSVCKSEIEIENCTHYYCQTCLEKGDDEFCICDKCIYNDKNHDFNHTLILCNDHLYKKLDEINCDCNNQMHFVLTPKILSRYNSLNNYELQNELSNKKNSLSSKPSTLSSDESKSLSSEESKSLSSNESGNLLKRYSNLVYVLKPKKLQEKSNNGMEECDNFDKSDSSSPKLVEDESDLDFYSARKHSDIFNEVVCVSSKIKKRRHSLKKNDHSFNSSLNYFRESQDTKLFMDKLLRSSSEKFFSEITKEEFKRVELLSISENFLNRIDLNIFSLINIRELNVEKNNIKKIPEEICELVNLVSLNVGYNLLVDLPYSMSKLSNLHTLIADYNDFRQIPPVITEMKDLKILYIEGNADISSFPPEEKMKMINELEIHIDNNKILMDKMTDLGLKIKWNGNYPVQILDKLYLGSYRSTLNEYVYKNLNISVVYTIGRDMTPLILQGTEHKIYIIDDFDTSNINFDVLNSIHEHINNGDRCLVHCQMGISRSATIVIAYLMKYCCMRLQEAYNFVLKRKCNMYPNNGFMAQLNKLNKELYPDEEIFVRKVQ
jgi:Leucine-rich repeat (LRR) protein